MGVDVEPLCEEEYVANGLEDTLVVDEADDDDGASTGTYSFWPLRSV